MSAFVLLGLRHWVYRAEDVIRLANPVLLRDVRRPCVSRVICTRHWSRLSQETGEAVIGLDVWILSPGPIPIGFLSRVGFSSTHRY